MPNPLGNHASTLKTRRTRFVMVSDTHSTYPKLPAADVIIHAGDLTNQGSFSELKKTLEWLDKAEADVKIVIAGNHDVTLDKSFYAEHGLRFHNQHPQDSDQCLELMNSFPGIVYLDHTSALIQFGDPDGPQTSFRVFGSPYVPARGLWAFGYDQDSDLAEKLWQEIPLDTDIVITHTPAYNHRDASPKWGAAGCEELRKALWRIRPKLAVCGHVHEARGVEIVEWRTSLPLTPFLEVKTTQWSDPGAGNKKMSLVDLSAKGRTPLLNNGAEERMVAGNNVSFSMPFSELWTRDEGSPVKVDETTLSSHFDGAVPSTASGASWSYRGSSRMEQPTERLNAGEKASVYHDRISRLDQQHTTALYGRHGRKETCIVNAAIMATSWGRGPKRSNKPIVVDIDLPIREEGLVDSEDHLERPTTVDTQPAPNPMGTR